MTRREYWERKLGTARDFCTADAAKICSVDQRTVQRWISDGRVLALSSTTEHRYAARIPRDALLEFLIRRTLPTDYPHYVEL